MEALKKCEFIEKEDGYLYLLQDNKTVKRWKLPLPKSDGSIYESPNDALADLLALNSRLGHSTVLIQK